MSSRSEQDPRTGTSLEEFQRDLADNLCYERGTTVESASAQDAYWTLAVTVRDRLADRRARTARANYLANPKFVYYLSAEYMLGRQLRQNALYTGTADVVGPAVAASGFSASELEGGYSPRACYRADAELTAAIDALASGVFSGGDRGPSEQVISSILDWDEYLVLADYRSYIDCHDRAVGPAWADEDRWTRMSILNTARSGYFSSDRTVRGYCRDIWHLESVPVPADTSESRDVLP